MKFRGSLSPWTTKVKESDIKIENIISTSPRKRLFCILEKDKPYALDVKINYRHFTHFQYVIPGVLIPIYSNTYTTSFRYSDEKDLNHDHNIVKNFLKLRK